MPPTTNRFAQGGRRRALAPALILALLAGCATTKPEPRAGRQVVLDNDEVQVVEATYPRDEATPPHTYLWPHVVYVIEGGTVQTTAANGSASTVELRPGQTFWRDVQTLSTRNVGSTTVRMLEIAVKNASTAPRAAEVFPVR